MHCGDKRCMFALKHLLEGTVVKVYTLNILAAVMDVAAGVPPRLCGQGPGGSADDAGHEVQALQPGRSGKQLAGQGEHGMTRERKGQSADHCSAVQLAWSRRGCIGWFHFLSWDMHAVPCNAHSTGT